MLVNSSERNPQLNIFFHPESWCLFPYFLIFLRMAGHTKWAETKLLKILQDQTLSSIKYELQILCKNLLNLVLKPPIFSRVWRNSHKPWDGCSRWKLHAAIPHAVISIQHWPMLWNTMHNLIPASYLLLKNMGDMSSEKLPDIKYIKCRKVASQGGESGAKK